MFDIRINNIAGSISSIQQSYFTILALLILKFIDNKVNDYILPSYKKWS